MASKHMMLGRISRDRHHEPRPLDYRPDVEGLRALSILLVVAAHAGVPWLEGGYVGVDVFFVLSGFLITRLLLSEIRESGRVRLVAFYARRMKRLLPALLFMLACTVAVAVVVFAPVEHAAQSAAARAAALWLSNLFFAFSDTDYFSPGADGNLFLHTWSLGVEEQFYLTWPFMVLFLLGAFAWQCARYDVARLRGGLLVLTASCFLLGCFLTFAKPLWGFYLMPSRAWEFGLGALAALPPTSNGPRPFTSPLFRGRAAIATGWLGALLIVGAAVMVNDETAYPGAWAAAPAVGAVLLLSAQSPSWASMSSLLSAPLLQSIGRISYSWYLWHWPVLAFGRAVGADDPARRLGLVALSLGLAYFSYRFVEAPVRYHRMLSVNHRAVIAASLALILASAAATKAWDGFAMSAAATGEQKRYLEVRTDTPIIYGLGCDDWFYSDRLRMCIFGDENASHTAVLIGDSVMGQWFPALARVYDRPGWRLLVLTKSSCPMVDEEWFYARIRMNYVVCSRWREQALAAIADMRPDVVLMGSGYYDFTESQWVSGTERVLAEIAGSAGSILVFRATPTLPFNPLQCLARREWQPAFLASGETCSVGVNDRPHVHRWLKEAASRFENVHVIDLNPAICPDGVCHAERDGYVLFRDEIHLGSQFVASLADDVAAMIAAASSRGHEAHGPRAGR